MKTEGTYNTAYRDVRDKREKISSVAKEFESIFTSIMIRAMRKTVGTGKLFKSGMGERIYTSMLDDEYAKIITQNASLGLADSIDKKIQEMDQLPSLEHLSFTDTWMLDQQLLAETYNPKKINVNSLQHIFDNVQKWKSPIMEAAKKYGLKESLIAAVIARESAGNKYAVSRAGAKGLMQLMDATAKEVGVEAPFDPEQNIDGGVKYLNMLLNKYNGNEMLALASYNAGPAAVDKYNGIPPYKETREYVNSVKEIQKYIEEQYKNDIEKE